MLPVAKLGSIVLAAPPGTAVYHATHGGWTRESHLLAAQMEQTAGLVTMQSRITRDGVDPNTPVPQPERPATPPPGLLMCDEMPLEEFERLRAANYALGESPGRVIGMKKGVTG